MDPEYSGMMGYTEEELKHFFPKHIEKIAEEKEASIEDVLSEIRTWYNGYRFF